MKKLFALILALALCFGLCACGQNDECEYCEDYEDLIEYLEDEKYDRAVQWILELAMEEEEEHPDDLPIADQNDDRQEEYNELVGQLENLEESIQNDWIFSIERYDEQTDEYEWLEGSEANLYLYERLLALDGYRDSQELAARFTLVEDVLLSVTETYTDALGNVNAYTNDEYYYGTDGKLAQGPAPEAFADLLWGSPNYEYDDSGKLVCLRNVEYDGTTSALLNITYNPDGTVASTDFKNANGGTETRSYVYENGLLTQCNIAEGDSYLHVETYTYNSSNQLERVDLAPQELDDWDSIDQTLYTYNPDGTVATKRTSTLSRWNGQANGEEYVHVWTYTYDSEGRVISALDVFEGSFDAEGNAVPSYTEFDKTYTYNYGDFCIYTPVG